MKRLLAAAIAVLTPLTVSVVVLAASVGAAAKASSTDPCGDSPGGIAVDGSGAQLAARAAAAAGFRDEDLVMAVAIAGAESSYQPTVRNSIGASGLWQILQTAHQDLFARYDWRDPAQNALMAHSVWVAAGHSWTPWTTFTSGAYRSHLPGARAAAALLPSAQPLGARATAPTNESPAPSVFPSGTTPTTAAGSGASSPPVCPPAAGGLPPAPEPFSGFDGYVDDPTSRGRITRQMLHAYTEVNRTFGGPWPWGVACWDPHAWNPTSDHPKGKACDFAVGRIGAYPSADQRSTGYQLARWLQANAARLGVSYIIWDGRIWSASRASVGWRAYGGGGVYDPASVTGGHHDHVHLSVR